MKLFSTIALAGAAAFLINIGIAFADSVPKKSQVSFNSDDTVNVPVGYLEWVYVGAPLTPNALNDGCCGR